MGSNGCVSMDVFQKLKTIYKDFAKAVESITVGVQEPPPCFIADVSVSY